MVKYSVTSSYFYPFKSYNAELLLHHNKAEDEDKITMKKTKQNIGTVQLEQMSFG